MTSERRSVSRTSPSLIMTLGRFRCRWSSSEERAQGASTMEPSSATRCPVATQSRRLTVHSPILASNGSLNSSSGTSSFPWASAASLSARGKYGVSIRRTEYAACPTLRRTVSPSPGAWMVSFAFSRALPTARDRTASPRRAASPTSPLPLTVRADSPVDPPPGPNEPRGFPPPSMTTCLGCNARTLCRAALASARPSRGTYTTSARISIFRGAVDTLTGGRPFRPRTIPRPSDRSAASRACSSSWADPPPAPPSSSLPCPSGLNVNPPLAPAALPKTGRPSAPNPSPLLNTSSPIRPDPPPNLDGSTPVTISTNRSGKTEMP
mmetsp:Transcript_58754/g.174827  ORF Transcript_58754/g.174827 Transcript_58754/m.174827 type:complete len:323 (-) Transcript_58754:297-1265(-)